MKSYSKIVILLGNDVDSPLFNKIKYSETERDKKKPITITTLTTALRKTKLIGTTRKGSTDIIPGALYSQDIDKTLKILPSKDFSRLAVICNKLGKQNESEIYLRNFKESNKGFANSYVSSLEMTRLHSLENNKGKALEQLNIFNNQKYHFIYSIRMLKDDPVFENINNLPEFKKTVSELETKFWANHQKIKANLLDKRLL